MSYESLMRYGRGGLLGSSAKTTVVSLDPLYFVNGLLASTASRMPPPSTVTLFGVNADISSDHVSAVYAKQRELADMHVIFF